MIAKQYIVETNTICCEHQNIKIDGNDNTCLNIMLPDNQTTTGTIAYMADLGNPTDCFVATLVYNHGKETTDILLPQDYDIIEHIIENDKIHVFIEDLDISNVPFMMKDTCGKTMYVPFGRLLFEVVQENPVLKCIECNPTNGFPTSIVLSNLCKNCESKQN